MTPLLSSSTLRRVGLVASICALMLLCAPAHAEDESLAYEGVVGLGAALCSVVYGPLKLAYTAGGITVGGLAWLFTFGDSSLAGPILAKSVGGDYVIMPAHLEGKRELRFTGR